ncbi:MAG TPA: helix-turn-helix domain-containing protein [Balneolaceae bacterium]|nr:helix-turn-helix domain-containing protein [Balneolaceae bacterium]
MNKSFSDKLTPGQVQQVFDALELPWRDYYNPENDGWVNIQWMDTLDRGYLFNSDLSVNINHGGFVDQYCAGHPDPIIDDHIHARGDLVTLVAMLNWESAQDTQKAIDWIQRVLGLNKGVKPPDMPEGYTFAKDFKECGDGKHVRMPKEILRSDLTASEKLVWAAIFDRCGKNEIYSFPGLRRIAKDTGLAKSTVQKAVNHLIEYELLIEKHRGRGKAPARFPLTATTNQINEVIAMTNEDTTKDTVPNSVHPRTEYRTPTVPNSDLNYTKLTRPIKLNPEAIRAEQDSAHSLFWAFYSDEQEEAFNAVLAKIGIEYAPEPPAAYQRMFIQTFADTHKLNSDGHYELSDGRVFDPTAIKN